MNVALAVASARKDGLLLTRDLAEIGITHARVGQLVRTGELVRVRRGAFVAADVWSAASSDQRHRLLVQATAGLHQLDLVFSHHAAAALHRLPLIGPWPERVHVLRPETLGGSSMPLLLSHRTTPSRENVIIDGLTVTSIERTLVDIASTAPHVAAVAMIDDALRRNAVTTDGLLDELAYVMPGRGAQEAARAIYFGDGRADSVGESLSRVRLWQLGFVLPELQVEFRDGLGFRAVVDFAWQDGRIVGEFDGRNKYQDEHFLKGRTPSQAVVDEKVREDKIRPMVDKFVRWDWDLAFDPRRFGPFLRHHGIPLRRSAPF